MTHRIQQESIKRRLAKLAAPIFIETLLIMMLGAVDTIMLSRHSDNSVAAVGVVNQIIMLTFLVFEVINLGTSVLCSQYLGARLEKKVVQVVGVSLLVNLLVGGIISLILFTMARTILQWMGLGPELILTVWITCVSWVHSLFSRLFLSLFPLHCAVPIKPYIRCW